VRSEDSQNFSGTHILGASRGVLCASSAVLFFLEGGANNKFGRDSCPSTPPRGCVPVPTFTFTFTFTIALA